MEEFLYKRLIEKKPKINVWWAYGNNEVFAMSSLGFLSIFKDIDLNPNLFSERIYLDSKTTRIPPEDVDCMGFSISFELDIFNIIKMLKKYNFPLKSSQRAEDDPIIFAGGTVIMSNLFPYVDFFDFFAVSERIVLNDVFKVLQNKRNIPRDELLRQLSEIEGIYVPKFKKKVKIVRDDFDEVVCTPILSDLSYFKNTFIVEVERGCPILCNFCIAGWLNHPVRFYDADKIIDAIKFGLKYTNKIALLGAYVAGHPDFSKIIDYIATKDNVELTISSLRADLSDENLIKTLVKCSQKTATIALEAGNEKLRNFINKKLTDNQIINTILDMSKFGLKGVKIYVMVGLPNETDKDIEDLVNLIKEIKLRLKENGGNNFNITVSASTFIPKPHTPFEEFRRFDKKTLENRINFLKKSFHKTGVTFRPPSIEWDMVQSILSRYDKSLFDFLIDVEIEGGNLGAFKKVLRTYNKRGLLPDFENMAIAPFDNIKAKNLIFDTVICESDNLKISRKNAIQNLL